MLVITIPHALCYLHFQPVEPHLLPLVQGILVKFEVIVFGVLSVEERVNVLKNIKCDSLLFKLKSDGSTTRNNLIFQW